MFGRKLFPFVILFALIVAGCSSSRIIARRQIENISLGESIRLDGDFDKAVTDPRGVTVFAMNRSSQEIHIFQDGKRMNSFGGLGFDRTSFQQLADIGVDTDGGLLALDTSLKILRKYTPEGRIIAELQLESLQKPELFCVGDDGDLFVYDATTSEIVCFSRLDGRELYRFGRFELEKPVWIACNHDLLYAYSHANDRTYVFYRLGQFKETISGQVVYDMFNNRIDALSVLPEASALQPKVMNVSGDKLLLLFEGEIRTYRIDYARGEDAQE
ncbi:MAG: hypothetical protein ACP5F3_02920 [Candidatus Syntrophosphaera sp.]